MENNKIKKNKKKVRLNGVRFDAHPSQVEPVIESDSVPKRFDERPAWIYRGRGAKVRKRREFKKKKKKDVEIIINELEYARYGYFQKLVDFGVDRLDHLASLGANDDSPASLQHHARAGPQGRQGEAAPVQPRCS
eukprot:TRINITY_DN3846_c4_g1_i2.p1 TRINITY_DN3846_c4_g1~~TRINITY_DN3846_c4_g1_i2.p1  ORF type:complete len:135 (+),score=18.52 TRINITY_DN3846_c4_g1_i2:174-578(+)